MQYSLATRAPARSFLTSPWAMLALAVVVYLLFSNVALASDVGSGGGGAGLPWEGPITRLRQSVSGPVAFAISLLGIIVCGATLIWGGEIGEFVRRLIMLILVISLIVFANTLLTGAMFSGATIPAAEMADVATAYADGVLAKAGVR